MGEKLIKISYTIPIWSYPHAQFQYILIANALIEQAHENVAR